MVLRKAGYKPGLADAASPAAPYSIEHSCFHIGGSAMQNAIDFQQLANAIGDAIIISDARGSITFWNPAAERMFGFTPGEALGNSLDLIIPERLRGRHWD